MKIVMFARAPFWYGFSKDRIANTLQSSGHNLSAIIVENTSTFASLSEWTIKLGPTVMTKKVLGRVADKVRRLGKGPNRSTKPAHSNQNKTEVLRVDSHNGSKCEEHLLSIKPDVLVLRGCGIVKNNILCIPRIGTINPHYAPLPDYRGVDVTEWCILHGDPCAVSVHWVTKEVDGGAVICTKDVAVTGAKSLGELRERSAEITAELLAEALTMIESGDVLPTKENKLSGRQYFKMHPKLYSLATSRLLSSNQNISPTN